MRPKPFFSKISLIFLGLGLALALVEVLMRATGYMLTHRQNLHRISAVGPGVRAYRILCLGESTTAPVVENGRDFSWPLQLGNLLNAKDPTHPTQVINMGLAGTNSGAILARLPSYLEIYKPDMVITMLGINDSSWYGIVRFQSTFWGRLRRQLFRFKAMTLMRHIYHELIMSRCSSPLLPEPIYPQNALLENTPRLVRQCWDFRWRSEFKIGVPQVFKEAESTCMRARRAFPRSPFPYAVLGSIYRAQNETEKMSRMYELAVERRIPDREPYIQLAHHYEYRGMPARVEYVFLRCLRYTKVDDYLLRDWAAFYYRHGKKIEAERIFRESVTAKSATPDQFFEFSVSALDPKDNIVPSSFHPDENTVTTINYRNIRDMILSRGIAMIAMQYPRNDIRDLVRVLNSSDRVIFVSNKDNFDKALAKGRYIDYFSDRFGKFWGHTTEAGHRLIAENLVPYVLTGRHGRLPKSD